LRLDEAITCPIYYAHPFSSYERGSNENANRLIRRWFPKGTTTLTPNEVTAVEQWINRYPRKLFNYVCPYDLPEVANLLL
ncbi:transposase, partial [Gemella sp. zg-1178]|uniref:transposase n=1 Tax=Gemella sp. zg-1178 TaxID=2840372 RepID=UPI003530131C